MPTTFAYKVRDQGGNVVEGSLEADDASLVVGKLRQMGYTPIAIEQKSSKSLSSDISIPGLSGRIKLKDTAVFSRQFATMINSGLSLIRALAILTDQTENPEPRADRRGAPRRREGVSLSAAIAKHALSQPLPSRWCVRVRSWCPRRGLMRLAYDREAGRAPSQDPSAMTYPIVARICLLIATAMLLFIVPQFKAIYVTSAGCRSRRAC
jgi:type IV pilus assembly protein PilC